MKDLVDRTGIKEELGRLSLRSGNTVSLSKVEVAQSDENLMPVILECVKEYATLGEISNSLRAFFGEYKEQKIL